MNPSEVLPRIESSLVEHLRQLQDSVAKFAKCPTYRVCKVWISIAHEQKQDADKNK